MNLWNQLWRDEQGAVLTAELVLLGSIAVIGGIVGLKAASSAVNDELAEMAAAIRSLDQSYAYSGQVGCNAWTAGSYYIQPKVEDSLRELCGEDTADVGDIPKEIDRQRAELYPASDDDRPKANDLPAKKKTPPKKSDKKPSKSDD